MKHGFSTFLILLFLSLQAISAVHAADYGIGKHKHHGKLCEFYLHAEQAKASDVPAPVALTLVATPYYAIRSPESSFEVQEHYVTAFPRAPPLFS